MKKFLFAVFLCAGGLVAAAQASIATDVSLLRSFTKGSSFWAVGQTVQAQYHFTEKTTAYAWVCYYTNGRFKNALTAAATDALTQPQLLPYTTHTTLRTRQLSLGIKQYVKGAYNSEAPLSLYALAGFGLLSLKPENTYSIPVDTARYTVPQKGVAGGATVVRLTADVGIGAETLLGSGIYWYGDVRTWIQASRFPSPYLYNNATPRMAIVSTGLRILFD